MQKSPLQSNVWFASSTLPSTFHKPCHRMRLNSEAPAKLKPGNAVSSLVIASQCLLTRNGFRQIALGFGHAQPPSGAVQPHLYQRVLIWQLSTDRAKVWDNISNPVLKNILLHHSRILGFNIILIIRSDAFFYSTHRPMHLE